MGLMYMFNAVNIFVSEMYLCINILIKTGRDWAGGWLLLLVQ